MQKRKRADDGEGVEEAPSEQKQKVDSSATAKDVEDEDEGEDEDEDDESDEIFCPVKRKPLVDPEEDQDAEDSGDDGVYDENFPEPVWKRMRRLKEEQRKKTEDEVVEVLNESATSDVVPSTSEPNTIVIDDSDSEDDDPEENKNINTEVTAFLNEADPLQPIVRHNSESLEVSVIEEDEDEDEIQNDDEFEKKILADIHRDAANEEKNKITIKLQFSDQKTIKVKYLKDKTFNDMIAKLKEKFGANDIILNFDGDRINPGDTPQSYDMEDDEIIDCIVK